MKQSNAAYDIRCIYHRSIAGKIIISRFTAILHMIRESAMLGSYSEIYHIIIKGGIGSL
jgi:hypothetical protein